MLRPRPAPYADASPAEVARWLGGWRPPHTVRTAARLAPRGIPGLREGLEALLHRVFDPPTPPGTGGAPDTADPGLFGPASASWRLFGEPDALVGGIRALVLQTMHPGAVAGVVDHSRFRTDPLGRLRSTAAYVTTATFGTRAQALEAVSRVRRVHRSVRGSTPDGTPYRADDPRLLAWIQVALTSSFLAADRLWAPEPLDGAAADRFVAERSRLAALLDPRVDLDPLRHDPDLTPGELDLPMMATHLPTTVAGLVDVLDDFAPDLSVGGQGRATVRFLRNPPLGPPLRAAYLWLLAGAAGSLAPRHRAQLGLPDGWLAGVAGVAHTAGAVTLLRGVSGRSAAERVALRRVATGV